MPSRSLGSLGRTPSRRSSDGGLCDLVARLAVSVVGSLLLAGGECVPRGEGVAVPTSARHTSGRTDAEPRSAYPEVHVNAVLDFVQRIVTAQEKPQSSVVKSAVCVMGDLVLAFKAELAASAPPEIPLCYRSIIS